MKFNGPRFSATVMIALTAATALVAVGLTAVPLQGPPGQDPSSTERFHGREVVAREVLVAFRQSPNIASLRADIDADADAFVGSGRVWRARSRSKNVAALIALLSAHREVLYVEPNYMVYTTRQPNDPRFSELWGLLNIGQTINGTPGTPGADIEAPAAWDLALGS